nr:hypothetical protein [Escherichia coli]
MSQKYLIRIAELESQLRQKDQQLSLVEETEAFLHWHVPKKRSKKSNRLI